ncbi:hypothetical protein GUJ93_ZPchr0006g45068 [Zizania palustris]|uniref:Uncharacterized protein n=1 Tax=Zizania palustris TaxID=103762 RepID=A0A8J5VQU1_ZIZPA|nr:hypothetical protein GUJ93_ZPchr0006g45068 [Zizania palustris]
MGGGGGMGGFGGMGGGECRQRGHCRWCNGRRQHTRRLRRLRPPKPRQPPPPPPASVPPASTRIAPPASPTLSPSPVPPPPSHRRLRLPALSPPPQRPEASTPPLPPPPSHRRLHTACASPVSFSLWVSDEVVAPSHDSFPVRTRRPRLGGLPSTTGPTLSMSLPTSSSMTFDASGGKGRVSGARHRLEIGKCLWNRDYTAIPIHRAMAEPTQPPSNSGLRILLSKGCAV